MSVLIKNSVDKRFAITFGYDAKLIEIIKKHPRAFFNSKKKEWSLPNEERENFINALVENKYNIQISKDKVEMSESVEIEKTDTQLYVKLNSYLEDFSLFKTIKNVVYDRANTSFIMPIDSELDLFTVLKQSNINFKVKSEDGQEESLNAKRPFYGNQHTSKKAKIES